MAEQQYETVMLRDNFYRDNYHKITWILLVLVFINLLLSAAVFYMIQQRPRPQYFASSPSGRLTPLTPLSQPMHSVASLLEWATEAAVSVYSYDFVHMEADLAKLSNKFTSDGYRSLMTALTTSNVLSTVKTKRLIVQAVPTGAARLVDAQVVNGYYTWKVSLPLLISYSRGGVSTVSQNIIVRMLVTRVDQSDNPGGIAVSEFTFSPVA